MMHTSFVEFRQRLYIPAVQNISFYFPQSHIIGSCICGNTQLEVLKNFAAYKDVLFR